MGYHKILVAVSLSTDEDDCLIKKALEIKKLNPKAQIYLLNAVEYTDSYSHIAGVSDDIDKVIFSYASEAMAKLCKKFRIDKERSIIEIGAAKNIILNHAEKGKFDLIVLGGHSKNSFGFILGSTANRVLNTAPCDVLSVKLDES